MSKLDKIDYELYTGIAPQDENGEFLKITPKTREQIKALFLELVGEDEPEYSGPLDTPTAYKNLHHQIGNHIRAELREKTNNL